MEVSSTPYDSVVTYTLMNSWMLIEHRYGSQTVSWKRSMSEFRGITWKCIKIWSLLLRMEATPFHRVGKMLLTQKLKWYYSAVLDLSSECLRLSYSIFEWVFIWPLQGLYLTFWSAHACFHSWKGFSNCPLFSLHCAFSSYIPTIQSLQCSPHLLSTAPPSLLLEHFFKKAKFIVFAHFIKRKYRK